MTDRKNEIVYATLELASEDGLGAVSMQKIADRVGITKASLYNHFSSKDEIVDAMYLTIREASKQRAAVGPVDYDAMASEGSMGSILTKAILSYRAMVHDLQLSMFYRIVMSERAINPVASEIMVRETQTMIDATEKLFGAIQRKGLASFSNPKAAAFSFAMAVHSMIDYEFDLSSAGMDAGKDMIGEYVKEFCRMYAA